MTNATGQSLGFWRCWALVVGGAIGSAIFIMPALVAPYGGLGLLSWAAAAVGALFVAMMFANLSRHVTRTGGPYAHAHTAFGDFGGFLVAWGFWISLWTACAGIAIAFIGYAGALVPPIADNPVLGSGAGLVLIWALVGVNIAGVKESGIFSLATTVLKLIPLVVIGSVGLLFVEAETLPPLNPGTGSSVAVFASAFAITFWTFVGIEAATVPSEDVIEPDKTVPRALIIGTLTIAVVYLSVGFAVMGMIPADELAASASPLTDAGVHMAGSWGGVAVAIGAIISIMGSFNVTLLAAGQTAMAASRDGVFPRVFEHLSARGTPAWSFVIAGLLASAMVIMSQTRGLVGAYTFVVLISTLTIIIPYAFSSMAGLLLGLHDGSITPARRLREAIVSMVAFLICIWVIATAGEESAYWTLLLIFAGLPVYVAVTRNACIEQGPGSETRP